MAQTTISFKCNNCETGIVKLLEKRTRGTLSLTAKRCNVCNIFIGLIGMGKLEEIKKPKATQS